MCFNIGKSRLFRTTVMIVYVCYGCSVLHGQEIDHMKSEGAERLADLHQRASEGDRGARLELARMYRDGKLLPEDVINVFRLEKHLEHHRDPDSEYALGVAYREGRGGVEPDPAKAASLFRSAAEKGHGLSMYALAALYKNGFGVKEDQDRAVELFEDAYEAGYINGAVEVYYSLRRKNPERAREFGLKALQSGAEGAEAAVGNMFRDSNPELAKRLLRRAIEKGDPIGYFEMAFFYYEKNPEKALELFEKGAEAGHLWSRLMIVEMCERGRGTKRDFERCIDELDVCITFASKNRDLGMLRSLRGRLLRGDEEVCEGLKGSVFLRNISRINSVRSAAFVEKIRAAKSVSVFKGGLGDED